MWKTLRWGLPGYMTDKITIEDDDLLETSRPRLQITAGSYRHKTVDRWNRLPHYLRAEMSIASFKKGVKEWIRGNRRNEDNMRRTRLRTDHQMEWKRDGRTIEDKEPQWKGLGQCSTFVLRIMI